MARQKHIKSTFGTTKLKKLPSFKVGFVLKLGNRHHFSEGDIVMKEKEKKKGEISGKSSVI